MHLAATTQNCLSHILDDTRQAIRSDMRMSIDHDIGICTMLHKHTQNLVRITALLAARVQLTIAVRTSTALAKTVIAFRVDTLLGTDTRNILLSFVHILATLHHYRAYAVLYQTQGSKEPCRSCTYYNNLPAVTYIRIIYRVEQLCLRLLVNVCTYRQVYEYIPLTRIDAAFQNPYGIRTQPLLAANIGSNGPLVKCLLRRNT